MDSDNTADDLPPNVESLCGLLLNQMEEYADAEMSRMDSSSYDAVGGILGGILGVYDTVRVEDDVLDIRMEEDFGSVSMREKGIVGDVLYTKEDGSEHPLLEFDHYDDTSGHLHFFYLAVDPENSATLREQVRGGAPISDSDLETEVPEINMHGITVDKQEETTYFAVAPAFEYLGRD